jgi:hypothetical protein
MVTMATKLLAYFQKNLTILKCLRLRVVTWRHDFQPCSANGLGLFDCWKCFIVGISLAEVIMTNIAYSEIVLLLFHTLFDIESRS